MRDVLAGRRRGRELGDVGTWRRFLRFFAFHWSEFLDVYDPAKEFLQGEERGLFSGRPVTERWSEPRGLWISTLRSAALVADDSRMQRGGRSGAVDSV